MSAQLVPPGLRLAARVGRIEPLYEDDALLVINKPAGIAVHGGAGETGATILEALEAAYRAPVKLHPVHRLDKGTSGVLLISKRPELVPKLAELWESVEKKYLAVALGDVGPQWIEAPLKEKDGRTLSARTQVTPKLRLERFTPLCTVVAVQIFTGRKHQIRRHLAGVGHPVLMDDQYGDFGANKTWRHSVGEAGLQRPKHPLLHAMLLSLRHPWTNSALRFVAPLGAPWRALLPSVDEASLIS